METRLCFCMLGESIRTVPRGFAGAIRGPHLEQPQDRESIWSVRRQTRELYFVVFIGLFLAGTGLASLRAFHDGGTLLDTTLAAWSDAAPLTITAAAAALALTEIGRSLMVLVRRLEEGLERLREQRRAEGRAQGRAEGRVEGRVEGRAEVNCAWREWNERRLEAEARGEPFTEPPPKYSD